MPRKKKPNPQQQPQPAVQSSVEPEIEEEEEVQSPIEPAVMDTSAVAVENKEDKVSSSDGSSIPVESPVEQAEKKVEESQSRKELPVVDTTTSVSNAAEPLMDTVKEQPIVDTLSAEIAVESKDKVTESIPVPVINPISVNPTQQEVQQIAVEPQSPKELPVIDTTTGASNTAEPIMDTVKVQPIVDTPSAESAVESKVPESAPVPVIIPIVQEENKIAVTESQSLKAPTVETASANDTATESKLGNALFQISSWFTTAKQTVMEKVGKAKVSEDPELQRKLNYLKEVKLYYEELSELGTTFCTQMQASTDTMNKIGILLSALAVKDKETIAMRQVASSYKAISRNTQSYLGSVNTFYTNVAHFKDKALEDTLETARKFEQARFDYDVALNKFQLWEDSEKDRAEKSKGYVQSKEELEASKSKYEKLKEDLSTKIDTLNLKRVHDMEFQLTAYLKNLSAYYSNNLYLVNKDIARPASPVGSPTRNLSQEILPLTDGSTEQKQNPEPSKE